MIEVQDIKWVKDERPYANGELAKVGTVIIGSVYWDSTRSKGENKHYRVNFALPNLVIKDEFLHHEKEEDAKKIIERAWKTWLNKLNREG